MSGWRLQRIMDDLKHWRQKCLRHQFSLPTNPSFPLWFQRGDIATCLLRRKDGPLLSFIFCWIITLSFFIWPFITDLSVFLHVYNRAGFSFIIYTGKATLSPSASFLSAPIGPSVEQSFSNLEQTLDSLPKPHHPLVVKEWTERDFMQKCCFPLHFLPSPAADIALPSNGVVECRREAREGSSSGLSLCTWSKRSIKL